MTMREWRVIAAICVAAVFGLGCACGCFDYQEQRSAARVDAIRGGEFVTSWRGLDSFETFNHNGLAEDWLEELGGEASLSSPGAEDPSGAFVIEADSAGMVDLVEVHGSENHQTAYAWADIESDEEGYSILQVGSDDGVEVWLNGDEVWSNRVFRAASPDQDQVVVWMLEGTNRILMKVEQATGGWQFCARFSDVIPAEDAIAFRPVGPVESPVVLVGSEFPTVQSCRVRLFQSGGEVIEGLRLASRSEDFECVLSEPFDSGPGAISEVRLPLVSLESIALGRDMELMLSVVMPDGREISIGEIPVEVDQAHPLLREIISMDEPFFVIQLSDTHIERMDSVLLDVNTANRLVAAIEEINAMNPQPAFVVVTGDFTHNTMQAYPVYEEIVSGLRAPLLTVFGNHDKLVTLSAAARAFSEWGLPEHFAFTLGGVLFVGFDSVNSTDPSAPGEISAVQLEWLDEVLGSTDATPLVGFIHHDLFTGRALENLDEVQALLEEDGREAWFFSGHWHADTFVRHGSQRHVVTTSTGYLFGDMGLPHDHGEPGYRLIHFDDGEIRTQFKPLGAPPRDDPPVEEYLSREDVLAIMDANE